MVTTAAVTRTAKARTRLTARPWRGRVMPGIVSPTLPTLTLSMPTFPHGRRAATGDRRANRVCRGPQLVKTGQRRLAGVDEKIIALYAGGMTTREIETYVSDLYGPGSAARPSAASPPACSRTPRRRVGRWRRSTRFCIWTR
jgi:Transposase, Mutator family